MRVGRHGRELVMCEFRSMHVDAQARLAEPRHLNEHDGILFKIRDVPAGHPGWAPAATVLAGGTAAAVNLAGSRSSPG